MFPLTMTGYDRTYLPPRSIRADVGGPVTAWDLFRLEHQEISQQWASSTLDSLIAAVESEGADLLGCTDCADTGFYGVADPDDPDLLTGLVRRGTDDGHQALATSGAWDDWDPKGVPLEVLSLDLAADLATAITAGACGLLRRYAMPRAFLPPAPVVAAAPLRDVLMSLVSADPPESTELSDNDWITYATVDSVDQGAVFDVVRVRLAGGVEQLERWDDCAWVPDPDLITQAELPMVRLTEDQLSDTQAQLNPSVIVADAPLTVSPNPKAEKLRRYWSTGRGGAKIRWNTGSDWRRCYRHLRKYMGLRAKGYCQNLHRRNTGMWTGDRRNRGLLSGGVQTPVRDPAGVVLRLGDRFQMQGLEAMPYTAEVVDGQTLRDRLDPQLVRQSMGVLIAAGVDSEDSVAVVLERTAPEPVRTELSRPGVAGKAEVQQPLLDGSTMSVQSSTSGISTVLAPTVEEVLGAQATLPNVLMAIISSALRHYPRVSHGSASERIAILLPPAIVSLTESSGDDWPPRTLIDHTAGHGFHNSRLSPEAQLLASIQTGQWGRNTERTTDMPLAETQLTDGIYFEGEDPDAGILSTITAGGFPVAPPDKWFENPTLDGPTPMVVDDDGRVYGHIATWDVTHIGMAGSTKAPHSPSNYAYFRTGAVKTEGGNLVSVGHLTLSGGHADTRLDHRAAVKHYDDTNSAVADVAAGEDQYGIWAAGALRPDVTPEQVRAFRASPPSGDWRVIGGNLELVAACCVNVPGFVNVRAEARVASGAILALVAAGARPLVELKAAALHDTATASRLSALEAKIESLAVPVLAEVEPVAADAAPSAEVVAAEAAAPVEPAAEAVVDEEAPPEMTAEELARAERIAAARGEVIDIRRKALRARVHPETTTAALPPQFLANRKGKDGKSAKEGAAKANTSKASTIKGTDSFPISDVASLRKAIQAFGRAGDKAAAKKHITTMAYKLKRPDLIPADWKASK